MIPDQIKRPALTEAQLAAERASLVEMYREQLGVIEKFTCDDCEARFTCALAFDAYNTDGDCLAEK